MTGASPSSGQSLVREPPNSQGPSRRTYCSASLSGIRSSARRGNALKEAHSRRNVMWARVSTYQFSSENLDQALDQINDALGSLDEPGLHRAELLVDRMSGKGM